MTLNAVGRAVAVSRLRSLPLWCLTITVGVTIAAAIFVNLFYGAPASSVTPRSRYALGISSYSRSRFGVVSGFDWHCARSIPTMLFFLEYLCQLWLLLSSLVVILISVFAILAALFIGDFSDESNEVRIANG